MNEPEHDAWLRAALAHAPDAGIGAPPALSEAILRAAAGPRPSAPPSPWRRLMDAWSWLARPPVAAGFASVMLASVIGLMWWERPVDEVMPRSPVPAALPTPRVTVAPAEPRSSAIVADRSTPPQAAEEQKLTREIAAAPTAVKPAAKLAPAEAAVRREPAPRAAAAAAPPAPQARLPAAPPAEQSMREDAGHRRRPESAAANAAPELARGAAPAPAPAAADASPAEDRADRALMQALPTASARARITAQAASPGRAEPGASTSAASPLAPLLALLSREATPGDALRWQPPDAGAPQPADAAARAWLQRVEQATRGRWSARAEDDAEPGAGGPTVMWWQGDVPLGTLQFLPNGLAWRGADGRRAWAPLDAATLAALRLN